MFVTTVEHFDNLPPPPHSRKKGKRAVAKRFTHGFSKCLSSSVSHRHAACTGCTCVCTSKVNVGQRCQQLFLLNSCSCSVIQDKPICRLGCCDARHCVEVEANEAASSEDYYGEAALN